jgi:hypothetical protein
MGILHAAFLRAVLSSYGYTVHIVSGDGDPDPDDFGPPGSGSISQRHGSGSYSGSGSFPFLIKMLSGLK